MHPTESWIPSRMENPQSLCAPVPVFDRSLVKYFPCIGPEFPMFQLVAVGPHSIAVRL